MHIFKESNIKIGWSWWTNVRLLFCKPIIGADSEGYIVAKKLDGKIYILKQGLIK